MTKPNGLHHLAIATADIKAQIEFFSDVLGMELVALYWMHGVKGAWHGFLKLNDHASVAFVHCAQVLEHVASPAAFLGELRRVLVPGGHAYVTAINRHALRDPHFGVLGVNYLPRAFADRVLGWLGANNPEGQSLSEMHYFSRRGFRRLCGATGLEMVADLKQRERLVRHGAVSGRLADLWGTAVRSAAFHLLVRRPTATERAA